MTANDMQKERGHRCGLLDQMCYETAPDALAGEPPLKMAARTPLRLGGGNMGTGDRCAPNGPEVNPRG